MEIRIQSIHFDAAEKLQDFIQKKVSKLERVSENITDADVVLKIVKPETANNKDASIKLVVKNGDFFVNKVADSFEEAIDQCVEALEKQLIKFKEKSTAK